MCFTSAIFWMSRALLGYIVNNKIQDIRVSSREMLYKSYPYICDPDTQEEALNRGSTAIFWMSRALLGYIVNNKIQDIRVSSREMLYKSYPYICDPDTQEEALNRGSMWLHHHFFRSDIMLRKSFQAFTWFIFTLVISDLESNIFIAVF